MFNDPTDVIQNCRVIWYAEDTVLFVASKNATDISQKINCYFNRLDDVWFQEIKLIMNLNKGKTEAPLFGKTNKVVNGSSYIKVSVSDKEIMKTRFYKYFRVQIDSTLNMNTFLMNIIEQRSLDSIFLQSYEVIWI